jgi:hypothetical protein
MPSGDPPSLNKEIVINIEGGRLKVQFKFKQLGAVDSSIYPICYWLDKSFKANIESTLSGVHYAYAPGSFKRC